MNIPNMSTIEGRAIAYREVLRTSLKRLVDNFIRLTRGGQTIISTEASSELLYEIHVQYVELLRYSQMVISDYHLLIEDEKWRSECATKAINALVKMRGADKARAELDKFRNSTTISHPDYAPSKLEIEGMGSYYL